jgi:hypothetical protein
MMVLRKWLRKRGMVKVKTIKESARQTSAPAGLRKGWW